NAGGPINHDFFTGFGLVNIIVSALSLVGGVIVLASGNKSLGRDLCLAAGLLLLIGIGTCSAFPFRLKH
ncbi:MAG TPA: hypothetical protein VF476_11085, partial [Chitinophagaceae bacterium]